MQPFLNLVDAYIGREYGVMVIVTDTGGSTPRKAGARMFVCTDGTTKGTVGGGWLELEATRVAKRMISEKTATATLERFGLRGSERSNTPMICGGDVELLFVPLAA